MKSLLLAFLFVLIHSPITTAQDAPSLHQLFKDGLRAEEQGNYEQALAIWLGAKANLGRPSVQVGRNYIRLATEQQMAKYYKAASAMYLWGLSGKDIVFQKEYVMQELACLEPLIGDQRRKKWNALLEANDPVLLEKMSRWWNSLDPTPATPYNERLVEHWQRIAYAREHFTRGNRTVYGTDDRGLTYVRYGEPERKFANTFKITGQEVEALAGFGPNGRAMKIAVEKYFMPPPYYEVWIYEGEYLGIRENLLKYFGETYLGPFRQVTALDELIPASLFTMSNRFAYQGLGGISNYDKNPGVLLQFLIYREVAGMDPVLAADFSRLEREGLTKVTGRIARQRHLHDAMVRQNKAPRESSTFTKELGDIPLDVTQYRLLDEENRPVYATFMNSRPQQVFLEDLGANQDSMLAGPDEQQVGEILTSYRLYHGVQLQGPDGQFLTGTRYQPTLLVDGSDMETASGSAFRVPFAGDSAEQVFYVELHNVHPASSPQVETPFPDELRGLGRERIPQPEPLDTDPSRLQMGDLILGWGMADSASADRLVPFVVADDRQIPEGEELALHVEVYHLQSGNQDLRDFSLDYEILPVNFLGWTRERNDQMSLTLNFQQTESRFTEDLSIKAADLEPGRYVLRIRVTDNTSAQQFSRKIEFEVIETGGNN